ncbi:cyclic nucleotide-binding domain-containing protein, partial [Oceanospirillum sp. HFRX-1_2]
MLPAIKKEIPGLSEFLSISHRRSFPKRSTLISAGAESSSLFYLIKGSVTVSIEDEDGHEMVVAYLNEGSFFGEMGLFDEISRRSAWVKAKTDVEVAEVSYTRFMELTEKDTRLLYVLGNQLAVRLRNTTRKVGDLAFMDVTGRVARTLLD